MSLPDKRGVALLASLVEAFVTVVRVLLLLLLLLLLFLVIIIIILITILAIIKITILNINNHDQVSVDSPAPWSLPVTTHRKVVDWHGEDWATQVILVIIVIILIMVIILLWMLEGLS